MMGRRPLRQCAVYLAGFLFSLFLVARSSFPQDSRTQISEHYQKAQNATREGRYGEAEGEYRAILNLDPTLAEVHANLGMLYYAQFKYAQAAEEYQEALKTRPTLNRARLFLGCAKFYLGQFEKSVQTLTEALSGQLEDAYRKLGRVNLARDYLALDQTENALAILKPLSQDFSDDPDIYYMLGKAYLRLSAAAASELGRAGDHPRARQMLAENFTNQRKFKEAIDEYFIALSLDANLPGARYPLALLLLHEGRTAEGLAELDAVLEASPPTERTRELRERARGGSLSKEVIEEALVAGQAGKVRKGTSFVDPVPALAGDSPERMDNSPLLRAQQLYLEGEHEAAGALLKELTERNPPNYDALYWLVKSYQALSIVALEQIGRVAPDSARAHQLLAEGFAKQERFQEAVKEYRRALERNPRLPGIHYAIGQALVGVRNYEEARKEFERELEVDAFNAGAFFHLGQMAYRDGRYDDALHYCGRALQIFPDFGEAHEQLGQVLVRKDRSEEAIPHLRAAARLLPDNHTIHYQLFRIYRSLGHKDAAQAELEMFKRLENEKKEATLRKAADSLELSRPSPKAEPAAAEPRATSR